MWSANDKITLVEIYDHLRTARMNSIAYDISLKKLHTYNLILEIVIAVGTSGSGFAGLALWNSEPFKPVWVFLAAISALAACLKPVLGFGHSIDKISSLRQQYLDNFFATQRLLLRIRQSSTLTEVDRKTFLQIVERFQATALKDESVDLRALKFAAARVLEEIPADSLWVPE